MAYIYEPGTLATLSLTRNSRINTEIDPVNSRKIKEISKICYLVTDIEISRARFNSILGYYASRFFDSEILDIPDALTLIVSVVGILGNCSEVNRLHNWDKMVEVLRKGQIKLILEKTTYENFKDVMTKDQRYQEFARKFGNFNHLITNGYVMLELSCIILLCCMKRLSIDNLKEWQKKRLRSFCGTIGDQYTLMNFPETLFLSLEAVTMLHAFSSSKFEIRKRIFLDIVGISRGNDGIINNAFNEIYQLMRSHELQHLVLIDKYIFHSYPEFANSFILKSLKKNYARAIEFLNTLPPGDILYAKILKDKDECAVLNRNNFEEAITVAAAIARNLEDSYKYYFQKEDDRTKELIAIVDEYMSIRKDLATLSIGEKDAKNMGTKENSEFFTQTLKNICNRRKGDQNDLVLEEAIHIKNGPLSMTFSK